MDAFSQNPKSISSSESDSKGWGSGTEGLKSHMVIVILNGRFQRRYNNINSRAVECQQHAGAVITQTIPIQLFAAVG